MNFVQVPPAFSQDSLVMYLAMHWKAGSSCPLGGGQVIPSKLFGITHISKIERLKKKARLRPRPHVGGMELKIKFLVSTAGTPIKETWLSAVDQKSPIKKLDNQKHIYVIFRLVSISSMESKE